MRRRTLALLALAWPLWAGAQAPACTVPDHVPPAQLRSEEHTSELQSH